MSEVVFPSNAMVLCFQIREEKFTRIGDYMYYFSGTSKKYIDAQQFCARVNAYLVEFYNLVQYREVCTRRVRSVGWRERQSRPDANARCYAVV